MTDLPSVEHLICADTFTIEAPTRSAALLNLADLLLTMTDRAAEQFDEADWAKFSPAEREPHVLALVFGGEEGGDVVLLATLGAPDAILCSS